MPAANVQHYQNPILRRAARAAAEAIISCPRWVRLDTQMLYCLSRHSPPGPSPAGFAPNHAAPSAWWLDQPSFRALAQWARLRRRGGGYSTLKGLPLITANGQANRLAIALVKGSIVAIEGEPRAPSWRQQGPDIHRSGHPEVSVVYVPGLDDHALLSEIIEISRPQIISLAEKEGVGPA